MKIINVFDSKEVRVGELFASVAGGLVCLLEARVPLFGDGSATVQYADGRTVNIPLQSSWESYIPPKQIVFISI